MKTAVLGKDVVPIYSHTAIRSALPQPGFRTERRLEARLTGWPPPQLLMRIRASWGPAVFRQQAKSGPDRDLRRLLCQEAAGLKQVLTARVMCLALVGSTSL